MSSATCYAGLPSVYSIIAYRAFFNSSEVIGAVWRHQATAANEGDDLAVMQFERHALQAALPTLAMTSHARGAG